MSCPGYDPVFQPQLNPGDPMGGLNCTAYSGAMAADDHTCGAKRPTGKQVRAWTRDKIGGTNLAQIDAALRANVGVDLDTRYRYPWTEFARRINAGQSAILQGWYDPIRRSRFRGSETFGGNHAILVSPGWVVMDPLADGRRAGIYRYRVEAYPQSLLREFAGKLNVGSGAYRALGLGLVYASFTRDNEPTYKAVVHPTASATRVAYHLYTVSRGVVTSRVTRTTSGFTVTAVTAPRLYRWPRAGKSYSLVQVTAGSLKGKYLHSKYAREIR